MQKNKNWGCFVFLALIVGFVLFRFVDFGSSDQKMDVADSSIYLFPGVRGPDHASFVPPAPTTGWKQFAVRQPSASGLAVLLTDTNSCWIGIAQGLKNAGVPFCLTTSINEALKSPVVMIYPVVSGKVFEKKELKRLKGYTASGGRLIACQILGGGLQQLFGFSDTQLSKKHHTLSLTEEGKTLFPELTDEVEQTIRYANPKVYKTSVTTNEFKGAGHSLMNFEDGSSFLCTNNFGKGKAYAIGMDLGTLVMRYANARGFEGYHKYANTFSPGMDVFFSMIRSIHNEAVPEGVYLKTVPWNYKLNVLITHDVDFTRSIVFVKDYADSEQEQGIKATYFVQTKYIKDWNDDIFFTKKNVQYLQHARDLGMEIASHSVAHSHEYARFPMGDGKEQYPDYRPFVLKKHTTKNGTILGELRISKFLLEHLVKDTRVRSFRPGHLSYPFKLPQALMATGFINSSSVTANNVMSHYPYFLTYSRAYTSLTPILEIPVTIEDELPPSLSDRLSDGLEVARKIGKWGGIYNLLMHTDKCGEKLQFQQDLVEGLKPLGGHFTTVYDFSSWWRGRQEIIWDVVRRGNVYELRITYRSDQSVNGVCFAVPKGWKLQGTDTNLELKNGSLLIKKLETDKVIRFTI